MNGNKIYLFKKLINPGQNFLLLARAAHRYLIACAMLKNTLIKKNTCGLLLRYFIKSSTRH